MTFEIVKAEEKDYELFASIIQEVYEAMEEKEWFAAGGLLVIVSCVKYREFIITAFLNNTWAWINALMPVVIILVGIRYMIRAVLK